MNQEVKESMYEEGLEAEYAERLREEWEDERTLLFKPYSGDAPTDVAALIEVLEGEGMRPWFDDITGCDEIYFTIDLEADYSIDPEDLAAWHEGGKRLFVRPLEHDPDHFQE